MGNKAIFTISIAFFFSAFSASGQMLDSVRTDAEQMPYFPGCTAYSIGSPERRQCSNQSVKAYFYNQIIYPQEAKDDNVEGAVYVRFIVDEKGRVQSPQLLKDIGSGCGQAALDVVNNMPQWEPAYHQGRPVKVALELPIHFYFKETPNVPTNETYSVVWGTLHDYQVTRKELRKNLSKTIKVFNESGKNMPVSSLNFSVNKRQKVQRATSSGKITQQMERLVKKLKKGQQFSVIVTVQKNGQFIEAVREYLVE
ncbi:MAG: energy transducer TonB [Bacteroidota bacterium]